MLWDGLFLVTAVVLAINGWNRGLIGSWRGPIAMAIATLVVQQFYVDFAAWVTSRLRINPESAVIVGYLMLWFSAEALLEMLLAMLLKGGKQHRPIFFNRLGGIFYGIFQATVFAILPLMAASVDIKIPQPPPDRSGLVVPEFAGVEGSYLVPGFKSVALAMVPIAGQFVVSTKPPSFTVDYKKPAPEGESGGGSKQGLGKPDTTEIENLLK